MVVWGNGQLLDDAVTILEQEDVQDNPAVIGAGGGRYLLAWQDDRNDSWDIYASLYQQEQNPVTVISYTYDPLYRLTSAFYTGTISATYEYQYDAVGNMTYYTETVGTETTRVNRSFNDANQLITAFDVDDGTSSYYYDGNGNLVQILPPGATGQNPANGLNYGYNQRNLMITNTLYITSWEPQADFAYDGMNNRLRQVDYTGATTTTITYTNDILGLSQALVADDGTEQVVNLFGLDLIHQDDGSETRTLLPDGLGSVRLEMADDGVETTTTFSPYGDTLAQTGTSGTVYGFTGEQEDDSTGLLYLRARYYNNPYLNQFQSRDPFPGHDNLPQSQNGYSYADNNPINKIDPSGLCAENGDETCWAVYEEIARRFPQALDRTYVWNLQYVTLDKLPWSKLREILYDLTRRDPNAPSDAQILQGAVDYAEQGGRFLLRVAPLTGDVIDIYEYYSYRDFVTGRRLTYGERMDIPLWACLPFFTAGQARFIDDVGDALGDLKLLRSGDDAVALLPPGPPLIDGLAPQNYPGSIPRYLGPHVTGAAGEEALRVLFPGGRKNATLITSLGEGRDVDWLVEQGGRLYAYESKNYGSTVTLGAPRIREEILKDWDLARTVPGYTPIWVFWDAGPNPELARFLLDHNISFIVYNP